MSTTWKYLCKTARKKNVMACCRKYLLRPTEVTAQLRDLGKHPGSGLVSLGTSVKVSDEQWGCVPAAGGIAEFQPGCLLVSAHVQTSRRRRLMHRNTCAALPEYMRAGFLLGKGGHVRYLSRTLVLYVSCREGFVNFHFALGFLKSSDSVEDTTKNYCRYNKKQINCELEFW